MNADQEKGENVANWHTKRFPIKSGPAPYCASRFYLRPSASICG